MPEEFIAYTAKIVKSKCETNSDMGSHREMAS